MDESTWYNFDSFLPYVLVVDPSTQFLAGTKEYVQIHYGSEIIDNTVSSLCGDIGVQWPDGWGKMCILPIYP